MGLTWEGPRNHVLDGVKILEGKGAILGVVWHIKKHCRVTVALNAAKINNGITAPLLQRIAMLPTGRCHIISSPVKNPPPCDAAFRQIFGHLLLGAT